MARAVQLLSPTSLQSLGPGLHHDGRGLYLQVKNGGRSWVLRYMHGGKPRYMGLGPFPDVTLAKARRKAEECRALLNDGIDPIDARQERVLTARLAAANSVTFKHAAEQYIDAHKAGWRNAKHAEQWQSTLETYAFPLLSALPVQAIDTGLVIKVLQPIWKEKTETATRLRQRIEAVLDWGKANGYRQGDNPARWRGHLDKLLPKASKVHKVAHFEAMPYAELPAFFAHLAKRDTISAKALAFTILTVARSGETRNARLGEVDFKGAIWTVPKERTKSGREHRVPLTKEALSLLRALPHLRNDEPETLLFPNAQDRPLSDTAMRKYLQEDMKKASLTVHGFRSTFRDWAAERTNVPGEIAEAALGHVNGDKTEAAYLHTDFFDRRRKLMEMWAKFCASGAVSSGKKVIPFRKRAAASR
jgi:integrase